MAASEPVHHPKPAVLPLWGERWQRPLFLLFLLCWAIALTLAYVAAPRRWHDIVLLSSAVLTTFTTLGRQLPLQNLFALALLVAGIAFVWNALVDLPLWWLTQLLWALILLNARAAAQFILRHDHHRRYYGSWLIGITIVTCTLATLLLDFSLYGATTTAVCAAAFLAASLPWYIDKRPVERAATFHPVIVLLALLTWWCLA